MPLSSPKKVLVAPLDWGMGHAARCVPVVRALLNRGHQVFIGGKSALLNETFPDLPVLPLSPYEMIYAATPLGLCLKFPFMVSRVLRRARQEHHELDALIAAHGIDAVISDQRFGCYSKRVPCAYISHQLCLKMPKGLGLFEKPLASALRFAASRFSALWIPDVPGEQNLTGDLAHKYPLPAGSRFVGLLSRFDGAEPAAVTPEPCDLLIMISGPEPNRTHFEKQVLAAISGFEGKAIVLLGRPGTRVEAKLPANISVYSHLPSSRTLALMQGAKAIICRGGYTTIMELAAMNKNAVLVPTPGQTEQEYLCERLSTAGKFAMLPQKDFNLDTALAMAAALPVPTAVQESRPLLDAALSDFGL